MGKKTVLFDFDGTLADTYNLILASQRYSTQKVLGRVIPDEVLMATVGIPLEDQMRDHTDDEELVREICKVYREHNARIHDEQIREFPGVLAAVEALAAASVPMGVVTSKRIDVARPGLQKLGFEPYMHCFIGGGDTACHKPHPEPILLGCQRMGCKPEDCIYVGDSPYDIQAGNAAGCQTVAVIWGMHGQESLEAFNPSFVAQTPGQMLEFCLQEL